MGFRSLSDWDFDDVDWGKVAIGAGLGIAAVAAAPFTGGGSVLAAVTLAESLTIGTAAAGVVLGAAGGACMQDEVRDNREDPVITEKARRESDNQNYKNFHQRAAERFQQYKNYETITVAMCSLVIASASQVSWKGDKRSLARNTIYGFGNCALPKSLDEKLTAMEKASPLKVSQCLDNLQVCLPNEDWYFVTSLVDTLKASGIDVYDEYWAWHNSFKEVV